MKSSGRPSAEVNAATLPARIRLSPSGVPTQRSPLGATVNDRITLLVSPSPPTMCERRLCPLLAALRRKAFRPFSVVPPKAFRSDLQPPW